MIRLIPRRAFNALGALACIAMLGFGYFLQFVQHLEPCPMCIFQRIAIVVLGLCFMLAFWHNAWPRFYALLIALAATGGAALSARHVWLQNLPEDQATLCGAAELDYLLEVFGPWEAFARVWRGTGDCTEILWQFLGLSIPSWTLVCFVLLGLSALVRNWAR